MTDRYIRANSKWAKISGSRGKWHAAYGWKGTTKAVQVQTWPTKDGAIIAARNWIGPKPPKLKPSQGPFKIHLSQAGAFMTDRDGNRIAMFLGCTNVDGNAPLFLAAPDLFAAAKMIMASAQSLDYPEMTAAYDAIEAAIAKVKGAP